MGAVLADKVRGLTNPLELGLAPSPAVQQACSQTTTAHPACLISSLTMAAQQTQHVCV